MEDTAVSLRSLEETWVRLKKLIAPEDFLVLASFYFDKDKAFFLAHKDNFLISKRKKDFFEKLLNKRSAGVPVAYLTGHKEFFGLDFSVTEDTLIPRPETEILVEDVLCAYQENSSKPSLILDIGTGSGCIAIAVRKNILSETVEVMASDTSHKALRVAKKNAKRQNAKIIFKHGSLLKPFQKLLQNKEYIYITANLPYVSPALYKKVSSEVSHEPKAALVSEDGGLAHYLELLEQLERYLPKNTPAVIWLEISPEQSALLTASLSTRFKNATVGTIQDLARKDRIVKILLFTR